jgi:hypothetical protein
VYGGSSVVDDLIVALFQDSATDALAATSDYISSPNAEGNPKLIYSMTAGTTSATTFRVRVGGSQVGTRVFNGSNGSRKFGTASKSSIVITEYKA